MAPLRIVFMGTAAFAVPSLEILCRSRHDVVAVVTAPDLPRGRGQRVSFTPVKEFAVAHGLPVIHPGVEKGALREPAFVDNLRSFHADAFLVVAFRILPPEVFQLPAKGCVNLHASLLPKYRGAAPINWAIIRGEKVTGVTTFFIQKQVDTGNVILQKSLPIGDDESAGELHDRLSILGAETLLETADRLADGSVITHDQEESQATTAPRIFKETCLIDWNQPAAQVRNFIRGLSPYPAALAELNGESFKILKAAICPETPGRLEPGHIVQVAGRLMVGCSEGGAVEILEWQPPSKKRMTVSEYLRGHHVPSPSAFT